MNKERLRLSPHPNPLFRPLKMGYSILLWTRVCDQCARDEGWELLPYWRYCLNLLLSGGWFQTQRINRSWTSTNGKHEILVGKTFGNNWCFIIIASYWFIVFNIPAGYAWVAKPGAVPTPNMSKLWCGIPSQDAGIFWDGKLPLWHAQLQGDPPTIAAPAATAKLSRKRSWWPTAQDAGWQNPRKHIQIGVS